MQQKRKEDRNIQDRRNDINLDRNIDVFLEYNPQDGTEKRISIASAKEVAAEII